MNCTTINKNNIQNFPNSEQNEFGKVRFNQLLNIIKIISIMLVVVAHTIEVVYANDPKLFSQKDVGFFLCIHTLARIVAVPSFFMISGYLLLTKKYDAQSTKNFYLKNYLPLLVSWEFWILVFNLFIFLFRGVQIKFTDLLQQMLLIKNVNDCFGLEWYMNCMLIIYLLIPFISMALNNIQFKFTVLIFVVLYITGYPIMWLDKSFVVMRYFNFIYLSYFIFGFISYKWLNEYKMTNVYRSLLIFVIIVLYALTVYFQWEKSGHYSEMWKTWFDFPFLPIIAFCLFVLINSFFIEKKWKKNKFLSILSMNTYGVYVIHMMFLQILNKYLVCNNIYWQVFILFLAPLLISYAISILISFIPIANKWIVHAKSPLHI